MVSETCMVGAFRKYIASEISVLMAASLPMLWPDVRSQVSNDWTCHTSRTVCCKMDTADDS
jgi:hypothetical protein